MMALAEATASKRSLPFRPIFSCTFNPSRDLKGKMCRRDRNAEDCFTQAQINAIQAIYDGPSDSNEVSIMKGKALGSEVRWPLTTIPHLGNNNFPGQMGLVQDYVNYLFFENDPGMPTANPTISARRV